ncbi:hypothetical protein KCP77_03200 [Salmonella enterica subsp. enterica]|nr:hypothetical protein KCP77_03200 [Salmonella enterica subsp. enterica]
MPVVDYGFISCSGLSPDEIKIKLTINFIALWLSAVIIATRGMKSLLFFRRDYLEWQPVYIETRRCRAAATPSNRFFAFFHFAIGMAKLKESGYAMWQGGNRRRRFYLNISKPFAHRLPQCKAPDNLWRKACFGRNWRFYPCGF